jgi:hypothetical protein
MTPKQSHEAASIMLMHDEPGWVIQNRPVANTQWLDCGTDPIWNFYTTEYRAVRYKTKRVPLPIEHYKVGMFVQTLHKERLVLETIPLNSQISIYCGGCDILVRSDQITAWRWPNETEWHPAYTEERGEILEAFVVTS